MVLSYTTKMTEIPAMKAPGIQVLIADDHSPLKDAIKSILNSFDNVSMMYEAEELIGYPAAFK
jgi:hypothetical protein